MTRLAVINVVGLTDALIGSATPELLAFRSRNAWRAVRPAFPAVTCTAQANYLTGRRPETHGIVANGWYQRELAEVHFWKQSNHLVQGPKIWDELRQAIPGFTCAQLFWWFNMYAGVDWSITPRPMYPADGRKVFDIYTSPFSLRPEIKRDLGEFPFPTFWGPAAGKQSPAGAPDAASRWIAEAARWVENKHQPTLNLIYLPHLDYNLQRLGPNDSRIQDDLRQIDAIVGGLVRFFEGRGVKVLVLSEYGITPVSQPIHLNRLFREQGWLAIKEELGRELLDCGASRVFAVADHQVAHVYLNDPTLAPSVRALLEKTAGVAQVFDGSAKQSAGLSHARAGDLIAVADEHAWFTYYYWLDDNLAPDFARTVDIHRKPGYDPVELFIDPAIRLPKLRILWRLAQKRLGFRMLMDVIPLDASLVKGSHGCCPRRQRDWPVIIGAKENLSTGEPLESTAVYQVIRDGLLSAR